MRSLDELLDSMDMDDLYEDAASAGPFPEQWYREAIKMAERTAEEADRAQRPEHFYPTYLFYFHRYAREVLVWAMKAKAPPRGKEKDFEKLQEALKSRKKKFSRKDGYNWMTKNFKLVIWMLETVKDWPEKDESTGLIEVAGFNVLDQISAASKSKKDVVKLISDSARAIKASRVPGASKALYGDVLLTGRAMPTRTLAYYRPREDDIWVRMKGTMGHAFEHSFIHEVGHRYYRKFMESGAKMQWMDHHTACRRAAAGGAKQLAIGDPLPVEIQGFKRGGPPVVTDITPSFYEIGIRIGKSNEKKGKVRRSVIDKYSASSESFPSHYSKTNQEEHWCEAFAFYCLKDLKGTHKDAFERIMGL